MAKQGMLFDSYNMAFKSFLLRVANKEAFIHKGYYWELHKLKLKNFKIFLRSQSFFTQAATTQEKCH